jgi:flagellar motility protein MotE (MotC chaperone)
VVIFSVVLVATGEWHNRVQPALRRAIVSRVLGDDALRAAQAAADSVSAARAHSARSESARGARGVRRADLPPALAVTDSVVSAAITTLTDSIESWRGAQVDSLGVLQEQLVRMGRRIEGLEAQLRILHTARDQGELDAWKALARVFASMRAEEAAAILQHLPETQAVQLLSSMKPASSAEVMGKLEPGRAARLSGRLTAYLRDLQTEAHLQ